VNIETGREERETIRVKIITSLVYLNPPDIYLRLTGIRTPDRKTISHQLLVQLLKS
jgi:hypothetical protein